MPRPLPTLQEMARLLGGEIEVDNGSVSCPGPGHNPTDRSLTVKPDASNPEGFVVKPFSPRDDWRECRDMVRSKLGLPKWEPKKKTKKQNGNGGGKPYSPTIAKYIYRTAEGEPYLCVHRLADKKAGFPQYHWDGEKWKSGKPKGEKIPYRLPELIAAPITTPVYVVEGEGKADLLAKLGFTVTSASEGAGKWTADLNEWFKDRVVYILLDNDKPGHDHGQLVARNLDPVAKSVRVVALPGLPHKGDIKQWLEHDPAGARLVKECERAPLWGPAAEKPRTTEADEALVAELAALSTLAYAKRRKEAADEIGIAVSLLDKAVAEARGEREVSSPVLYPHWNVDPSDEPVEIAALLRSLIEVLRRYVVMTEEQTLVVALWIVFTWLHEQVAVHSPILLVTAPTDTCGKTTLLHVVGFLVRNGMSSVSITGPALFRSIEKWAPTFALDEADTAFKNEDLKDVFNSGWTRGDAIIRCDPETHEPRPFSTFCPKAIGMIGRKLPRPTLTRCLIVAMRRKRPDQHVEDFEHIDTEEFARLRSQLLRLATDNAEALTRAKPEIPPAIYDRRRMNWKLLLAIAEQAGCKQRAWKAVEAIEEVHAASEPDRRLQALSDIRDAFDRRRSDQIVNKTLIDDLIAIEGGPWASYGKSGKPITDRQLGGLLSEFRQGKGIKTRVLKVNGEQARRYYVREDFEADFASYLLSETDGSTTKPPKTTFPSVAVLPLSNTNDLDGKAICCGGLPATDENPSNPLEEKAYNTATDKKLENATTASMRACDYCHEQGDDPVQQVALDGETLWLHRHCELPFLDAQDEGLDIPECLKVENRGKWGKPSGDLS